MTRGLEGRTALITGAAKRLGRAVALALARKGVHVVVHYGSSSEEAEATAEQARARNVNAWTLQADLGNPSQAEGLLPRAVECAGQVDILINNASIFEEDLLADSTVESIHRNVAVNALAPFFLARRFAAQAGARAVINFLDTRITDYDREHCSYHLSKRMLHTLTKMMALEFAPAVRVNAVAPGLILPPEGKDKSYLASLAHTNPLNRYGGVEDITRTVLFLLESDFVTGQTVYVDGGRHMRGAVYD